MKKRMHARARESGFTLVEAVMVIVITGIIASMVGVFISKPIEGYFASSRRAELTDVASTAIARIRRDIRSALPNSVRLPGSGAFAQCVEFLPTFAGGRYRAVAFAASDDPLDTTVADTTFDVLGGMNTTPAAGDFIVINNSGTGSENDAYQNNRSQITNATLSRITFSARKFTASPSSSFQVVSGTEQAVFYSCSNVGTDAKGNGTGTLYRFSAYGFNAAVPGVCPTPTASTPVLATNISACEFHYNTNALQRNGLVWLTLTMSKENENVSLHHEIHVNNTP